MALVAVLYLVALAALIGALVQGRGNTAGYLPGISIPVLLVSGVVLAIGQL